MVTAAGFVLCGSPKKRPRTSSIVQFIFFFWSIEISGNILRNLNFYTFRPVYSKQVFNIFGDPTSSLSVHSGSLKRNKYSKLYSLAHSLLLNAFSALFLFSSLPLRSGNHVI